MLDRNYGDTIAGIEIMAKWFTDIATIAEHHCGKR
jgi:hypothetical protein